MNRTGRESLFFLLTIFSVFSFFSLSLLSASDISIFTGEIPPYSYSNGGKQAGVGSDLCYEICRRVGLVPEPESLPWARALHYSLNDNAIIYPLGRNSSRESQYHWIGPIIYERFVFYVHKDASADYQSVDDFKNLKVGVITGASPMMRLKELGFTNLDLVTDEKDNAYKLKEGRIDAWYAGELIILHIIRTRNLNPGDYKLAFVDIPMEMYIGASLNLKDQAEKWQEALDEMKKDGTYKKILEDNFINSQNEVPR